MRTIGRTASLVLALALSALATGFAPAPPEPPLLATPPHQADPWTPPRTRLPRFFVEATRMLFDQGLADPRGCEYRTIRITPDRGFRRPDEVDYKGWVLPPSGGGKPRGRGN